MFQRRTGLGGGHDRRTLTAVTLVAGLIGGATAIQTPIASAALAEPSAGPL